MKLRPYQAGLFSEIDSAIGKFQSVLLTLPTGGGKTIIAAELAASHKQAGSKVWFLCHRQEIMQQASEAFEDAGVEHGRVAWWERFDSDQAIQVCSLRSLGSKLDRLQPPDLVIWDEAHHLAAPSWSQLKERFPAARHLGLTATPCRLDGLGLGNFFDWMVVGPDTSSLIDQGWLSPFRYFAPSAPDLRGVAIRMGDYKKDELTERMSGHALVGDVIDHYAKIAPKSRALAFCVSVEASRALVERFNAAGIRAAHLDAKSPRDERAQSIADLQAGRISLLSSVEIFTEGLDAPTVDAVLLLRPTRSFGLYRQMVGRSLRVAEGKRDTIILDHAGLVYEHGLPDDPVEWSLTGDGRLAYDKEQERKLRSCPSCAAVHDWAGQCPHCGHAYAGGERSVDEVFGNLVELRRRPGYLVPTAFAARMGVSQKSIRRMLAEGLPNEEGRLIPINEGRQWLIDNWRGGKSLPPIGSLPGEYEPQKEFARRVGRQKITEHMKMAGIPRARNGWIHVERGLAWLREWERSSENHFPNAVREAKAAGKVTQIKPAKQPPAVPDHIMESIQEFSITSGLGPAHIRSLMKRGLPLKADGSIDGPAALKWINTTKLRWVSAKTPKGYVASKTFAKLLGKSNARHLVRWGLPVEPNGLVNIEKGLAWWRQHKAQTQTQAA